MYHYENLVKKQYLIRDVYCDGLNRGTGADRADTVRASVQAKPAS